MNDAEYCFVETVSEVISWIIVRVDKRSKNRDMRSLTGRESLENQFTQINQIVVLKQATEASTKNW